MHNITRFKAFFLASCLIASPAGAATTYSNNGVTTTGSTLTNMPNVQRYDNNINPAQQADYNRALSGQPAVDPTTYRMDANGFLVPDAPGALLPNGQQVEEKPAFTQRANNPARQVYKGDDAQKKALVAPRTHRMYDDTVY